VQRLVGRQRGTPGHSLVDNIKVVLKEVRWGGGLDLIVLPRENEK
jgi:hypothetical protein